MPVHVLAPVRVARDGERTQTRCPDIADQPGATVSDRHPGPREKRIKVLALEKGAAFGDLWRQRLPYCTITSTSGREAANASRPGNQALERMVVRPDQTENQGPEVGPHNSCPMTTLCR